MPLFRLTHCAWLVLMGAGWSTLPRATGPQGLPQRVATAAAPPRARRQTRFPDTLHAQPLAVRYWTGAEVDTLQAELGTTQQPVQAMTGDPPARYRVFQDEGALRLFYRPLASAAQWIEVDLTPWLVGPSQPYLRAYAVDLDRRAPEEILVKMSSGSYGSGYRTTVDQTLLLSLDGPPRLLWQSTDGRVEEIPPTRHHKHGELIGGNFADHHRTVALRHGLVYVSGVQRTGRFAQTNFSLTPITPGYYRYTRGQFRRVTSPKSPSTSQRAHPTGEVRLPSR